MTQLVKIPQMTNNTSSNASFTKAGLTPTYTDELPEIKSLEKDDPMDYSVVDDLEGSIDIQVNRSQTLDDY